jgi:hypothetical protein
MLLTSDFELQAVRENLETMFRSRRVQDSMLTTVVLQHLALVDARRGDLSRAARLLGYVNVEFEILGLERGYIEKWSYDQLMLALLKNFREAELEAFVAEGAAWSEDHAVEEALLL